MGDESNDLLSASGFARALLIKRRWIIVALLFVAGFINYLDRVIISVALPVIAIDLHLGPAKMGILLSAFFWSYAPSVLSKSDPVALS